MIKNVLPIGILAPNATKEQEINHINNFVAALPKETYLYQIFKDFLGTAERVIRDDEHYNILETLNDYQDNYFKSHKEATEATENAEKVKKFLHEEQREREKESITHGEDIANLKTSIDYIHKQSTDKDIIISNLQCEADELRIALINTNDQNVIEVLRMDLENLERDNKNLYREINGYKAQIELLKEMLQEQIKRGRITTD